MNLKKGIAAALIILLFTVLGCNRADEGTRTLIDGSTAFSVNGQKISVQDFKKRLFKARYVQEAQGTRYEGAAMYQQLTDNTINLIVKETLVMQQAEKAGIAVPEEEVEKVIRSIKSNFPTEEEFKALMLSRGLDEETMKNYNRMQLTSVALVQKLGNQQKYKELINEALAKSEIVKNEDTISNIVDEISKISSEQLLSEPGKTI